MSYPRAVFFDLDETLVENVIPIQQLFGAMYGEFSTELGVGAEEAFFSALRQRAGILWNTMFELDSTPEQQLTHCFATAIDAVHVGLGETLAEPMFERFIALTRANVRFQPGAAATLQKLQSAGVITGLITNGIERLQCAKIHHLELEKKVDHVIVSAQARAHKPHAKVFELALGRAGVKAEEAWQVGDHALNDVAGAIRAGMTGVFYDPSGERRKSAFDDLVETPKHTISHLLEVVDLAIDGQPMRS